jgi:hypothetical protein
MASQGRSQCGQMVTPWTSSLVVPHSQMIGFMAASVG